MNFGISVLFRLIPIIMGLICLFLGLNVLSLANGIDTFISGHVLISLTAICYALFTTATVIIQQLIGSFNRFWMFFWPITGYIGALVTIIWGATLLGTSSAPEYFVAGHVVMGVGMIAVCVSTVAAASSKFTLIPKNAASSPDTGIPTEAYSSTIGNLLLLVPISCFVIGLVWVAVLLVNADVAKHFVAGNVLLGLTLICSSLISLVASVVRQVRNIYSDTERWYWGWWVLLMGTILIVLGIYYLNTGEASVRTAPAIVLVGLGMICYSISSKVWLLALVWRRSCELAVRIPLIPVFTCLFCLFTTAFLADLSFLNSDYYIPSKVLMGLGAVCFTLFSIVSILEAGTSK